MLEGLAAFCTLDIIQEYWQTPLHASDQVLFAVAIAWGLCMPTKVPQGVCCQRYSVLPGHHGGCTMIDGMIERRCLVWVDDAVIWDRGVKELLCRLGKVLARYVDRRLFAAAHKTVLFKGRDKLLWATIFGQSNVIEPNCIQGLVEVRRPETSGDLLHFFHAVNWMRAAIPAFVDLEASVWKVLEECFKGATRARRVADRRVLTKGDWAADLVMAWERAWMRVAQAVPAYHRKEGYSIMDSRAKAISTGWLMTHVPRTEFACGTDVPNMSHETLGFVCGTFKHTRVGCPIVDKEAFAIVNTCVRLEDLL